MTNLASHYELSHLQKPCLDRISVTTGLYETSTMFSKRERKLHFLQDCMCAHLDSNQPPHPRRLISVRRPPEAALYKWLLIKYPVKALISRRVCTSLYDSSLDTYVSLFFIASFSKQRWNCTGFVLSFCHSFLPSAIPSILIR